MGENLYSYPFFEGIANITLGEEEARTVAGSFVNLSEGQKKKLTSIDVHSGVVALNKNPRFPGRVAEFVYEGGYPKRNKEWLKECDYVITGYQMHPAFVDLRSITNARKSLIVMLADLRGWDINALPRVVDNSRGEYHRVELRDLPTVTLYRMLADCMNVYINMDI